MATVRIYRVAELLNTSSQEVMALLKRDHGIDVKSASSTIEEVVARQFVERLARQRNITVPSSASFADAPTAVRGRKPAAKTPEPQRPAAVALPPPRLVKTAKPAAAPADPEAEHAAVAPTPVHEPTEVAHVLAGGARRRAGSAGAGVGRRAGRRYRAPGRRGSCRSRRTGGSRARA